MRQMEVPSAETAIEEARGVWERGYREAMAAGREIPVVDVPREYGDAARMSVEATQSLTRLGNRRSYTVSVDLKAMEAKRQAIAAKAEKAQKAAKAQPKPKQKRRRKAR